MTERLHRARRARSNGNHLSSRLRIENLEDRQLLTTVVGLGAGNLLLTFDSASPGTILGATRISGITERIEIVDIDFRPATGELYGLSSSNAIFKINPNNGAASRVGPGMFGPALDGNHFGVDFNPVVDRIRIVSDREQNLRLHPDLGTVVSEDKDLAYATSDVYENQDPNVVSGGYTNNFVGATTTTLYVIDSKFNTLAIQNPPNDGVLNTVGSLGVNANAITGFDITADNKAFASFDVGPTGSQLFSVDLQTGAVTLVGNIGQYVVVRDIALKPTGRRDSLALGTSEPVIHKPTLFAKAIPPSISFVTTVNAPSAELPENHVVAARPADPVHPRVHASINVLDEVFAVLS